ncbi:hypothetical protein ABR737_00135 [Streptomyces sp. Edi2]|uniref:hypothetical protein n=1 Tax=Streptomyces sp. Edi2 TaxID=3162528 RepID=UPI00330640ED
MRALGLLDDARRILAGAGLERPAEVAESCLRGAADALLGLPGALVAVGLKSAAWACFTRWTLSRPARRARR